MSVAANRLPPQTAIETTTAATTLASWQQLVQAQQQITVGLRSGYEITAIDQETAPTAEPIAVHVLSVGGAVAWWLSIDGKRGGMVVAPDTGSDGLIRLLPLPAALSGIQQAFAQQRGETPAGWVYLPAPQIDRAAP